MLFPVALVEIGWFWDLRRINPEYNHEFCVCVCVRVCEHRVLRMVFPKSSNCKYSASTDKVKHNCHFPASGRNCMTHRLSETWTFAQYCNTLLNDIAYLMLCEWSNEEGFDGARIGK
jgi:hypothetical protein